MDYTHLKRNFSNFSHNLYYRTYYYVWIVVVCIFNNKNSLDDLLVQKIKINTRYICFIYVKLNSQHTSGWWWFNLFTEN